MGLNGEQQKQINQIPIAHGYTGENWIDPQKISMAQPPCPLEEIETEIKSPEMEIIVTLGRCRNIELSSNT